jgi:hypothetical protein
VLEASFDALADVMAVVEESKRHPAEREQLDRLGPLVLLYEVTERSPGGSSLPIRTAERLDA